MRTMGLTAAAGLMAALLAAPAAQAGIRCQNGYQVVQGNLIATPYCQEALLAKVAREYGFHETFAEIRNNPNTKRRVCTLIGRDIRVQETCVDANITGRRGF